MNFALTKTTSISLNNDQIVALKDMGRYAVMKFLGINESQAKKVVAAVKDGVIVVPAIVKAARVGKGKTVQQAPSGIAVKCCVPTEAAKELYQSGVSREEFVKTMVANGALMSYAVRQYLRAHRWYDGYVRGANNA